MTTTGEIAAGDTERAPIGATETPRRSGESARPPRYAGDASKLFWLVMKTGFLTVITLGIYRFWMKTHVRQFYWNAIRVDEEPLEYTGRALELLLGFLMAILFLAIYLFAVNFALITASIIQLEQMEPAIFLSFLAVLPFVPYASYRSQRYLLSRTRWRGIRFGLDLAAWSYAGRWFLWTFASLLTLGLLSPIADFSLRKFITDRMSYGDQQFRLVGKAGGLYRGYLPAWGMMALAATLFGLAIAYGAFDPDDPSLTLTYGAAEMLFTAAIVAYFIGFVLFIWYSGFRLQYLLNRMEFGDGVRLQSSLSPTSILGIVVGGYLLTFLIVMAVAIGCVLVGAILLVLLDPSLGAIMADAPIAEEDAFPLPPLAQLPLILGTLAIYLVVGLVGAACFHVFIAQRTLRKIVSTAQVENLHRVVDAKQRPHAKEEGAEGFADALDVGAF